ncbi:hypothetical protein H632_c866p0, partial [Helicosporidium sp. ATCC 50920]
MPRSLTASAFLPAPTGGDSQTLLSSQRSPPKLGVDLPECGSDPPPADPRALSERLNAAAGPASEIEAAESFLPPSSRLGPLPSTGSLEAHLPYGAGALPSLSDSVFRSLVEEVQAPAESAGASPAEEELGMRRCEQADLGIGSLDAACPGISS